MLCFPKCLLPTINAYEAASQSVKDDMGVLGEGQEHGLLELLQPVSYELN